MIAEDHERVRRKSSLSIKEHKICETKMHLFLSRLYSIHFYRQWGLYEGGAVHLCGGGGGVVAEAGVELAVRHREGHQHRHQQQHRHRHHRHQPAVN